MKDTIVTAIYFSSPYSRIGGRGYSFEFYEAPFRNLLNLGCNIVVYTDETEHDKIKDFFEKYNFTDYKLIKYDLNNFIASDKIYEFKVRDNIIDENGLISGSSYSSNDRNHHLCLQKPYFLQHTININIFESECYYWVDAGLFHHGLFPETYGGIEKFTKVNEKNYWPQLNESICNPTLFKRLENKNSTNLIFMGIDNYYGSSSWFSNYSEQFKHTHIIGGLFGGNKNFVLDLCTDFNNLIGNILNDGYLTLEEEVLSILFSTKYHQYNYLSFKTWYHDIPTDPNYFGLDSTAESFYKIFLNTT